MLTLLTIFLTGLLFLETVVRILFPSPAPLLSKTGVYYSVFPLLQRRKENKTAHTLPRHRLKKRKMKDELRIFVFGESCVEGALFDRHVSPPSMLLDQLEQLHTQKEITVVNMGRSGSFLIDSYYHLLGILRFSPDIIIFFQGINDNFHEVSHERCMPVNQPLLHRLLRFLVQYSSLLWTIRVYGNKLHLAGQSLAGKGIDISAQAQKGLASCDAKQAFGAWTDILVRTALRTGAEVFVTTPVVNTLEDIERRHSAKTSGLSLDESLQTLEPSYLSLLSRILKLEGDLSTAVVEDMKERPGKYTHGLQVLKVDQWKNATENNKAHLVDFCTSLKKQSPFNITTMPLMVDEVHLSFQGYWLLAADWTMALAPYILKEPGAAAIASNGWKEYTNSETKLKTYLCFLAGHGKLCVERRMFLFATALFHFAAKAGNSEALKILSLLRRKVIMLTDASIEKLTNAPSEHTLSELLEKLPLRNDKTRGSTNQLNSPEQNVPSSLVVNLMTALDRCNSQTFHAYHIDEYEFQKGRIAINFISDTSQLQLILAEKTTMRNFCLENNLFGISYAKVTPLDSQLKIEAVNKLFYCIQKQFKKNNEK